ncbi:MAG: S-layer protein, partial [Pirellulaceae bacterium]
MNDVVPVLTRAGCNIGVCHAKAVNGQNGFLLSLLGFEPQEDYDHLVREARGRRVSPSAPDSSLLLMKATARMPHGGGKRLDEDSEAYRILRTWIAQGMPNHTESDPQLVSFAVEPARGVVKPHETQQLKAVARYSDGTVRDVT